MKRSGGRAAQRRGAYADVLAWLRVARPKNLEAAGFTYRCFRASFFFGILVIGLIGLLSPSSLGQLGAEPFRGGWPTWVLAAVVAACIATCVAKRDDIRWVVVRLVDPWRRPMSNDPNYRGMVDALELCTQSQQSRFAWSFVWGPLIVAVLATAFAFSAAYFVVAALLARFVIGWGQPILAAANAFGSLVLWRLVVKRMATWRLAASVYKSVSTGYL